VVPGGAGRGARDDALNALLALGYNEREATAALAKVDVGLTTSDAIRQSLKLLSKVV